MCKVTLNYENCIQIKFQLLVTAFIVGQMFFFSWKEDLVVNRENNYKLPEPIKKYQVLKYFSLSTGMPNPPRTNPGKVQMNMTTMTIDTVNFLGFTVRYVHTVFYTLWITSEKVQLILINFKLSS